MRQKNINPRPRGAFSPRALLERERFQLPCWGSADEKPWRDIKDVMNEVFKKIDARRSPELLERVRAIWRDVAGEREAAHSRPGYLDSHTLIVFVDSAVWLGEISRYGRGRILAGLQKSLGQGLVREIRFRLDP